MLPGGIATAMPRIDCSSTATLVTHDVTGAQKFADDFAILDKGRITAHGTADELKHSDNPLVRGLAAESVT